MSWFSILDPLGIWLVSAGLLFVIEILTGTGWLLCLSLAAFTTSGLTLIAPTALFWQWLLFSAVTILLASLRAIKKMVYRATPSDVSLNDRIELMKGMTLVLNDGLINGTGQTRIGDSVWFVRADSDYPAGTKVRVTGMEGVFLRVTVAE
ncbi:TPA: NfeD family protein [Enterobacter hormaechei subsp. steigerwaltii]|nr:NfeD family protein [Enterobacter hormaechei subsp. steigerwaltii]